MWIVVIYLSAALVGLAVTYFPKSHHRADAARRLTIFKELDIMGGVLSITGLVLLYDIIPAHPRTFADMHTVWLECILEEASPLGQARKPSLLSLLALPFSSASASGSGGLPNTLSFRPLYLWGTE